VSGVEAEHRRLRKGKEARHVRLRGEWNGKGGGAQRWRWRLRCPPPPAHALRRLNSTPFRLRRTWESRSPYPLWRAEQTTKP